MAPPLSSVATDLLPPFGHPEHDRRLRAWLLELLPPDVRAHQVGVRHLLVLLLLARDRLRGSLEGSRRSYSTMRADLSEQLPPEAIAAALHLVAAAGRQDAAALEVVEEMLAARGWED